MYNISTYYVHMYKEKRLDVDRNMIDKKYVYDKLFHVKWKRMKCNIFQETQTYSRMRMNAEMSAR